MNTLHIGNYRLEQLPLFKEAMNRLNNLAIVDYNFIISWYFNNELNKQIVNGWHISGIIHETESYKILYLEALTKTNNCELQTEKEFVEYCKKHPPTCCCDECLDKAANIELRASK